MPEPDGPPLVSISRHNLDALLAVAVLYLNSFSYSDYMSLAERLQLRAVQDIVAEYRE